MAATVLAALPLLASCAAPPARAEQAPVGTTAWRALGSWAGDGSRQTDSFDVATGALRLRWATRSTRPEGGGTFHVSLYSAISGRPLQVFVEHTGAGSGTAHVADDPRVSYLVIEADGVAWTTSLDEAVAR